MRHPGGAAIPCGEPSAGAEQPQRRSDHGIRRAGRDQGSMTIEVAFLLVLLVVPLFYLVGTVGRLQAGAYAVTAAAREAGRTFVTASSAVAAPDRARSAAGLVYRAHGFTEGEGQVTVRCQDVECLAPGSTVLVEAEVAVLLPLVPDFVGDAVPTSITLTSTHVESVDAFRAGGG